MLFKLIGNSFLYRGRRRPRIFKLKFHHQALPPEYLDHYEASLRQTQQCHPPAPQREDLEVELKHPAQSLSTKLAMGPQKLYCENY